MQLAFQLGRTTELARREALSVATTLPFLWSSSSLPTEWAGLKPTGDDGNSLVHLQKLAMPLQDRLGGTQRIVVLLQSVSRGELMNALAEVASKAREQLVPGGRLVGLSVWGRADARKLGIALKRALRDGHDWSSRVVLPSEGNVLGLAQVVGERLAGVPRGRSQAGIEVVAIEERGEWQVGVTLAATNIDFYTERDFGIPAPDAVSGMLPPKLAQTMVNLAVGGQNLRVHDPFCGNGRVVLEAFLMGLSVTGSDISEAKVTAAQKNLQWLAELIEEKADPESLWTADATLEETRARIAKGDPYVLVGEPYLGKPLKAPLQPSDRQEWLSELIDIYSAYLRCWAAPEGRPVCHLLVMPRAKVADGSEVAVFENLVDRFKEFGYHPEVLSTYDRPDSLVRRDIVRLTYTD